MNLQLKSRIVLKYGTSENFALALRKKAPVVSNVIHHKIHLSPEQKKHWAGLLDCQVQDIFPDAKE